MFVIHPWMSKAFELKPPAWPQAILYQLLPFGVTWLDISTLYILTGLHLQVSTPTGSARYVELRSLRATRSVFSIGSGERPEVDERSYERPGEVVKGKERPKAEAKHLATARTFST